MLPFPSLATGRPAQEKILHDEFSFTSRKWPAAVLAGDLTLDGVWSGFDFDDVIERVAVRAMKMKPLRHERPPFAAKKSPDLTGPIDRGRYDPHAVWEVTLSSRRTFHARV